LPNTRDIRLFGVRALVVLFSLTPLAAQVPSVDHVEPSALRPGHTTTITIAGDNLKPPAELWTSFPALIRPAAVGQSAPPAEQPLRFDVTLPKDQRPGIGAIRVITPHGISRWSLLLVDPCPTLGMAIETNTAPTSAALLAPGWAIDGGCDELKSDYFRIHGRKGDRIAIDVIARQIGSPMDPLIRLTRLDGHDESISDDASARQGDPALTYQWKQTGDRLLEVRDTQYRGGRKFRYRLRIGTESARQPPFLAGAMPALPTVLSEIMESEPNDELPQARAIFAGASLRGRFDRPGDRDVIAVRAGQGERWIIRGRTRSLGSPCDLYLKLSTTNGTKIATANLGPENEGSITNTFTDGGAYLLTVEELNHRGGEEFFYRIDAELFGPRCDLSVDKESIQLPPGGSAELTITAERRDYDGEIRFEAREANPGFQITNHIIKAKEKETKLRITAPATARPGQWFHCRLVGSPAGTNAVFESVVSTRPALRNLWSEMSYPPEELDGWIAIAVRKPDEEGPKK